MVLVAVAVCAGIVRESAEQVAEARVNLHDCRRLLHERRAARTQRANVVAALSGGRTIEFDSHRRLPVACSARPKRERAQWTFSSRRTTRARGKGRASSQPFPVRSNWIQFATNWQRTLFARRRSRATGARSLVAAAQATATATAIVIDARASHCVVRVV